MIYGIGTDIVQLSRVRAILARSGERFARKVLGPQEFAEFCLRRASSDERALHYLANRYAVKEAFCKALGTGFRAPMSWHGLQTINAGNGRPQAHYAGALQAYMLEHALCAHVAISDEAEYALAFVTLEQVSA